MDELRCRMEEELRRERDRLGREREAAVEREREGGVAK